jgi:hypothetical protein
MVNSWGSGSWGSGAWGTGYATVTTKSNGSIAIQAIESAPYLIRPGSSISLKIRLGSATEYETLRQYLEHATTVETRTSHDGSPSYRERIPSSAPIDALLLEVVPTEGTHPDVDGVWGVVEGGDDGSLARAADPLLEFDLLVLAKSSEYSSHSNVESEFKITV